MDFLIEKYNQLQEQCTVLHEDCPIELPEIVVVGTQSAGKSSLLEALVRYSFLPRGQDVVTRCPLVLQLHRCPLNDTRRSEANGTAGTDCLEEWGEFSHQDGKIFKLHEIQQEIMTQTDILAGENKNICKDRIILKIFSPNLLNLTLVDTPGITRIPVEGQDADIEKQTCDLAREFISNEMSIVLAVAPANQDITTSDGLKLALEVDPELKRTLVVLTKLDLIPAGTEDQAFKLLNGEKIFSGLGIVGVKSMSQKDIVDGKESLEDEQRFLRNHKLFREISSKHGIPYLSEILSQRLIKHIKLSLPIVQNKVTTEIAKCQRDLKECGDPLTDDAMTEYLKTIMSRFTNQFFVALDAGHFVRKAAVLHGGAKIAYIFRQLFKDLCRVDPCEKYCLEEVVMTIRNANGTRPPFLVSELALEALIKPLIGEFLEPSLKCVEAVIAELCRMCNEHFPRDVGARFPRVKETVLQVAGDLIDACSKEATRKVEDEITVEEGHISYERFDALKGDAFKALFSNRGDEGSHSDQAYSFSSVPFKENVSYKRELRDKRLSMFNSGKISNHLNIETDLLEIDEEDTKHVIVLGEMLKLYYGFVSNKVADTVEKLVMHYAVTKIRNTLQIELSKQLYRADVISNMFREDEASAEGDRLRWQGFRS